MVRGLLLFMLSFVGVMFSGPALALLAVVSFKINFDRLMAQHPLALSIAFGFYGALVSFMFFWLQDVFIVFRPPAGAALVPKAELIGRLEKAFGAPVEGKQLFDFKASGDRAVITWASSVNFFQGTSVGGRGMKRVVVLTFDERTHDAYFVMQDKDWKWNVSTGFAEFSLNYSTGISAEFVTVRYPSIVFSGDGGLQVDVKKLTYSSDDLWLPIQTAVLSGGWTLRGGMLPKFAHRVLFSVPLGLLFFLVGLFVTWVGGAGGASPAKSATSAAPGAGPAVKVEPYVAPADLAAQLEKAIPSMTTEILHIQLDGIMRTPKQHVRPDMLTAFGPFARAYIARPGADQEFVQKLRVFADENGIAGLKP